VTTSRLGTEKSAASLVADVPGDEAVRGRSREHAEAPGRPRHAAVVRGAALLGADLAMSIDADRPADTPFAARLPRVPEPRVVHFDDPAPHDVAALLVAVRDYELGAVVVDEDLHHATAVEQRGLMLVLIGDREREPTRSPAHKQAGVVSSCQRYTYSLRGS
jgi:hypothetical protein